MTALTIPLNEFRPASEDRPHTAVVSSTDYAVNLSITVDNMGAVSSVGRVLTASEARSLAAALVHFASETERNR